MTTKKLAARAGLVALGLVLGLGGGACGEAPEEEAQTTRSAITAQGGCAALGMTNDDVCVCTVAYFGGQCKLLTPTRRFYSNLESLDGSGTFGDNIESYIVGDNVRMKACVDDTYRGTCDTRIGPSISANMAQDYSNRLWSIDRQSISSIYVDYRSEDCFNPGPFEVALFRDIDYNPTNCTLVTKPFTGDGLYPTASKNADPDGHGGGFGWPHDSISSVITGAGVKVLLYKDSNYAGGSLQINQGAHIPRLAPFGFDNIISSIKVISL